MYYLNHVTAKPKPAIMVDLVLEGKPVRMELDTGAPVSLMSWTKFNSLFPDHSLQSYNLPMQTYLGEPINVRGQAQVEVQYEQQRVKLPLVIVDGNGPTLFGRQWLDSIKLNWKSINHVWSKTLQSVLDCHPEVFRSELGTLKGYKAKISVDPNARLHFCKARSVSYAMTGKVEKELKRLEKEGIIEPVQFADWAAPIVAVLKADGKSVWREIIHQAQHESGLPAATARRGIKEVRSHQHSSWVVQI